MKPFAERNPYFLCAIGVGLTIAAILAALNYDKLPFLNENKHYSGYFAEAGGLLPGAPVQVAGYRVGQIDSIKLDGDRVLVDFNVDQHIKLGDRTEAAIKTKSLLGTKIMELTPRGDGQQDGPIPLERTRAPYQLPDALGDLTSTISGLNTDQLSTSLSVLSNTFKDTPPDISKAVQGVGRFSDTLARRDANLRDLLANANKVSTVLGERSDQIVALIADTNALLVQLQSQSTALDEVSHNITALAGQLKGFIAENRDTFKPALEKLNGVLTIVDNRKQRVQEAIKKLNTYAMSLGESVASGPFFKAYVANLLPGQFVQPFVDAAFSDLGLDPHVLLPSQLGDPQVGQPGTPPMPVPFPRTGQGGEPRLNLPEAITGNPGDPRYPYREPSAAPPPGGPPPGPPAIAPPELQSTPNPTAPTAVFEPAPGEPVGPQQGGQP
jgi:phospholipid/cholesterol/gamma-HCH transport system substrate-binding protein